MPSSKRPFAAGFIAGVLSAGLFTLLFHSRFQATTKLRFNDDTVKREAVFDRGLEQALNSAAQHESETPRTAQNEHAHSLTDSARPPTNRLAQLNIFLNAGEYERAVAFYLEFQEPELRQRIFSHMRDRLSDHEHFRNLNDAWRNEWPNDIEALLLLAEHQGRQGYFSEAVLTLDYAFALTDTPREVEAIAALNAQLYEQMEAQLTRDNDVAALLDFYRDHEKLNVTDDRLRLREARLLLQHGEESRARKLLHELLVKPAYAQAASEQLRQLSEKPENAVDPVIRSSDDWDAVFPLETRGAHFLAKVDINARFGAKLLVDTGASLTTLTFEKLREIQRSSTLQFIEKRQFSTAAGTVIGEIYQAETLRLGPYTLNDVYLVATHMDTGGAYDGLLGMNVLGQFEFQLDHSRARLLLRSLP